MHKNPIVRPKITNILTKIFSCSKVIKQNITHRQRTVRLGTLNYLLLNDIKMHETNFVHIRAQAANFLHSHRIIINHYLPLVSMCHPHLCTERQMTGVSEGNSCPDSHKYEQSVTGLNGNSQGGGSRDKRVTQSVGSQQGCLLNTESAFTLWPPAFTQAQQ